MTPYAEWMIGMSDGDADREAPVLTTPQEWRRYLLEYGDLLLSTLNEDERSNFTAQQWETRWLGRDPASEGDIAAAERRLGVRFPPSLRSFLLTSDGWYRSSTVDEVLGCADINWMRECSHGPYLIEISEFEDADDIDFPPVQLFERALEVAGGNGYSWLLDPVSAGPDGEFPVYKFLIPGAAFEKYTDFAAIFHSDCQMLVEEVAEMEADGAAEGPNGRGR